MRFCLYFLCFASGLTACQDDPYNNNEILRDDGTVATDAELLGGIILILIGLRILIEHLVEGV